MEKEEFLSYLEKGSKENDIKIQCLQYFIDHYPVEIDVKHPLLEVTIGKTWTSLDGYKVKDDIRAMQKLDENFNKLKNRYLEIRDFKTN